MIAHNIFISIWLFLFEFLETSLRTLLLQSLFIFWWKNHLVINFLYLIHRVDTLIFSTLRFFIIHRVMLRAIILITLYIWNIILLFFLEAVMRGWILNVNNLLKSVRKFVDGAFIWLVDFCFSILYILILAFDHFVYVYW